MWELTQKATAFSRISLVLSPFRGVDIKFNKKVFGNSPNQRILNWNRGAIPLRTRRRNL